MRKSDGVHDSGALALLFTEIEGRTQRWDAYGEIMAAAVARHDELIGRAVQSCGGRMYKKAADATFCAFENAENALRAAYDAQRALAKEDFSAVKGLRVRMAIDSGPLSQRRGIYVGVPVDRASGLLAVGHGGQVLLSAAAARSAGSNLPTSCSLRDLGPHVLRHLLVAERVYQLAAPGLQADFPALRSLQAYPNNIPAQRTSFLDREDDIANALAALAQTRLLTLVGTGGVGKTRLALQLAATEVESYADGVWLVELAQLRSAEDVARRVAGVFGVRELPGHSLTELIRAELADRPMLLVLDNCEHVIDAVSSLAEALLDGCRDLKLMCTSREPLGIAGEHIHRLNPLAIPERADAMTADEAFEFASIQLFVDRARAAGGEISLPAHAGTVARIVRRLDGIPLAIELAASRARTFVVGQLETMLNDRLQMLSLQGNRRAERHSTMRALLDWSYELLTEQERRCFERLAAFSGGWTLDAAQAVALDEGADQRRIAELIASLIDKSLVVRQAGGDRGRYGMLESTRDYAVLKLSAGSEERPARERHAAYFAKLAATAEPAVEELSQQEWLRRFAPELDNFRAAMDWMVSHEPLAAARMAESLFYLWLLLSLHAEGLERSEAVLAAIGSDDPQAAATVLALIAYLRQSFGSAQAALAAVGQARELIPAEDGGALSGKIEFVLGRILNTTEGAAASLPHLEAAVRSLDSSIVWKTIAMLDLGYVHAILGDLAEARRLIEPIAARSSAQEWPDRALAADLFLAEAEFTCGAVDQAIARAREIAARVPEGSRHWVVQINLGCYLSVAGKDAEAAHVIAGGLERARAKSHTIWFSYGIEVVALLAARAHQPEAAAQLLGFTDVALAARGTKRTPTELIVHRELTALLGDGLERSPLGEPYRRGAALDLDHAADIATGIIAAVSSKHVAEVQVAILREEIAVAGRTIAITAQETAVMLLLARAQRVIPADELCTELWPDVDLAEARSALNSCLYRLRKKSTAHVVEALDDGYRLGPDVAVDLWTIEAVLSDVRFQQHLDAPTLERLSDVYSALQRRRISQLMHYDWFVDVDAHLVELQRYAGERLLREQFDTGDLRGVARRALEMLMVDPCDETAAEYAIRAHLQLGNAREAALAYERYAGALKRQLDAEPSEHLTRLVKAQST